MAEAFRNLIASQRRIKSHDFSSEFTLQVPTKSPRLGDRPHNYGYDLISKTPDPIKPKRVLSNFNAPLNELEVLNNSSTNVIKEKTSPKISLIRKEALRASKRSKSFNFGRTSFAQRMAPILMAQRLKKMALTRRKQQNLNVNVSDVKNSSLGMLDIEENVEKQKKKPKLFDPNARIDQRREALPVSRRSGSDFNNEKDERKKQISPNSNSVECLRARVSRMKKQRFILKEKVILFERRYKEEREKKRKLLEENKHLKSRLRKSNSSANEMSEMRKKIDDLRMKVKELNEDKENYNNKEIFDENEEEMVKMRLLMDKRKVFFEKKMKQLAKKVIDYEEMMKKIKFKATEIKKQNLLFARENKNLLKQMQDIKRDNITVNENFKKVNSKLKYIKSMAGDSLKKLNIDL